MVLKTHVQIVVLKALTNIRSSYAPTRQSQFYNSNVAAIFICHNDSSLMLTVMLNFMTLRKAKILKDNENLYAKLKKKKDLVLAFTTNSITLLSQNE